MDITKKETMLLGQTRNLKIKHSEGTSTVEDIPEWLAAYVGKERESFINKPVDEVLENVMPGISELAERTRVIDKPVNGFRTGLLDKNGIKRQFVLETANLDTDKEEITTTIYIQELPESNLVSLKQAEFSGLIGASAPMQRVFNKIKMYSASEAPVLVTGETGTGKEGVAGALHKLSSRSDKPFITMNCSAITETLFESELFGHEKGSFTGAIASHKGRFERANGGFLFLDEVGDLPLLSQAKLLRALETSQIERVGSEKSISVDVRIVAATNRDLEQDSHDKKFRADLFYRINALHIKLPPLRERTQDIPLLIEYFIAKLNKRYSRNVVCLTRDAMQLLKQYQWPGNIRELRNLMERLFAENQTDVIGLRALKEWYEERMAAAKNATDNPSYAHVTPLPYTKAIPLGLPQKNEKPDFQMLKTAYEQSGGNVTKASKLLGIHKATFYRTLKNLGMTRKDLETTQALGE